MMSHPARGAWIEMWQGIYHSQSEASHPARGAWIEMDNDAAAVFWCGVAPREGCVD